MVNGASSRQIGKKIVRVATPLATMKRGAIPSPSAIEADQMLLPHMSKNGKLHLRPEVKIEAPIIIFQEPSAENNPYLTDKLKCQ